MEEGQQLPVSKTPIKNYEGDDSIQAAKVVHLQEELMIRDTIAKLEKSNLGRGELQFIFDLFVECVRSRNLNSHLLGERWFGDVKEVSKGYNFNDK